MLISTIKFRLLQHMMLKNPLRQRLISALFVFLRRYLRGKGMLYILTGAAIAAVNYCYPYLKETKTDAAYNAEDTLIPCKLNKVIDGDTVKAVCGGRYLHIRLSGIDAPETEQVPWGGQSAAILRQLLPIDFTMRPEGSDIYHRQLATIFAGQKNINLTMIESGWAVAYKHKNTPKNYKDAQRRAKRQHLGVWSVDGPQQDPKKWRRYHKLAAPY